MSCAKRRGSRRCVCLGAWVRTRPRGLVEHLGELRARLVVVLVALAAGFAIGFGFHHELIHWLNQALPAHRSKPVTFGVAEPFMTSMKVSLYAGFAIALPVILWQVWSLLAPAVRKRSKCRSSGSPRLRPCCAAGVGFGHEVALPAAVHFLTNYDSGVYDTQIRASSYYSFAVLALLAVGLVFELPVLILGLVRFRVLTAAKLRRKPAHRLRHAGRTRRRTPRRRPRHDRIRNGAAYASVRGVDLAFGRL